MTAANDRISIPDRSWPGTTTAFPVGHQGGSDKCATGAKLRGGEDITIATWNVRKVGEDAQEDWVEVCGPSCNPETNDRGFKLIDFATYNNIVLANTLGNHNKNQK